MAQLICYLSVGSNQGNRGKNLVAAYQMLPPAVRVLRTAKIYQTQPWGYSNQANFFNTVWEVETSLPPESLLLYLKDIERRLGRTPNFRNGPRIIDLDILLYGQEEYRSANLTIPHISMPLRRFVLQPLCDLVPDLSVPPFDIPFNRMLAEAPLDMVEPIAEKIDYAQPEFRWGSRTYSMGIINITPDSFSGDGISGSEEARISAAIQKAEIFLENGVDILDIGAESSRPNSQPVSEFEERSRLMPVLSALRSRFPSAVLSVDTQKPSIAKSALAAGADWLNDINGGAYTADIAETCAENRAIRLILMRNQPLLCPNETAISSEKLIERIRADFLKMTEKALRDGLRKEQIILDPGIGFGATPDLNVEILRCLAELRDIGYPLLIGPSRKSFLGHYLQREETCRVSGTAGAICAGISKGADIIRFHDVELLQDVIKIFDLVVR